MVERRRREAEALHAAPRSVGGPSPQGSRAGMPFSDGEREVRSLPPLLYKRKLDRGEPCKGMSADRAAELTALGFALDPPSKGIGHQIIERTICRWNTQWRSSLIVDNPRFIMS